jgi:hypothetical protein
MPCAHFFVQLFSRYDINFGERSISLTPMV